MSDRQDRLEAAVHTYLDALTEDAANDLFDAALDFKDADEANIRWMFKGIEIPMKLDKSTQMPLVNCPKFIEFSRVFSDELKAWSAAQFAALNSNN